MSEPRPTGAGRLVAGVVLALLGLALWGLYAVQAHRERHSYAGGSSPPQYVKLVAGHRYWISIHGGVQREAQLGVSPGALVCTAAGQGRAPGALEITAERADTKAINQIASFTPSFSGYVHVECQGIGTVYVDDAADAPVDRAATWLVLASLCLAIGLPLALSGFRGLQRGPRYSDAGSTQPPNAFSSSDATAIDT